jgi:hypothetical protein
MSDSSAPTHADALQTGITQFNRGEYYDCHDTLEAIWMEASTVEKPFFQGILQLAVALYHLSNHNWQGAAILLGEGISRLEPFEPSYREVNVTALLDCADDWLVALQQGGPEQVDQLADTLTQLSQEPADLSDSGTLPKWQIQTVS